MISALIGFVIITISVMAQMAIVRYLPLLNGSADLVLVVLSAWALHERSEGVWIWALIAGILTGFISAMPFYVPLISYLVIVWVASLLRSRVWQSPILAMFVTVFIGTLFFHLLTIFALQFLQQISIGWQESLNLVTIPSLVLNLLLTLPFYVVLTDLAGWFYPAEVE
jgi:hypothetical protein